MGVHMLQCLVDVYTALFLGRASPLHRYFFIRRQPLVLIALVFWGCASPLFKVSSPAAVKEQAAVVNYGPTHPIARRAAFRESSRKYGLEGVRGVRFYAVDIDQDTWTDLVVLADYFAVPQFYRFEAKRKRFVLLSPSPLHKKIQASFLNFVDLNKDGVLDMVLAVLGQKSELTKRALRIFRGEIRERQLFYHEVEDIFGPKQEMLVNFPLASLSALDFDLDGKLDFFAGAWLRPGHRGQLVNSADMLFKGDGFQFQDHSFRLSGEWQQRPGPILYPNATPTFASATCDMDSNGHPDILTASSHGYPNKLWLNREGPGRGERVFVNFGAETGYAQDDNGRLQLRGGGHTFFVACADYNNDSTMDIFMGELSHAHGSPTVDRSSVLSGRTRSFPLSFIRTPYAHDEQASWSQGDRRGVWLDYDNDGLLDLLVDNSGFPPHSRLVLFHQQSNHAYLNRASELGIDIVNPEGSIVLDINRDGQLDILTGQGRVRDARIRPRLYLFENAIQRKGRRSMRFFLQGRASNARGIGAMLSLQTNRGIKRQWVEYHQGAQGSQNEEGLSFGLRKGERPLQISVRWPARNLQTTHLLSSYRFSKFLAFTLCEDGSTKVGGWGNATCVQ